MSILIEALLFGSAGAAAVLAAVWIARRLAGRVGGREIGRAGMAAGATGLAAVLAIALLAFGGSGGRLTGGLSFFEPAEGSAVEAPRRYATEPATGATTGRGATPPGIKPVTIATALRLPGDTPAAPASSGGTTTNERDPKPGRDPRPDPTPDPSPSPTPDPSPSPTPDPSPPPDPSPSDEVLPPIP